MDVLTSVFSALLDWLSHGLSGFNGWEIVAYTLITTHITIAAVTIFLHRSQAHRALDLHPIVSHFFRFWLWLASGMVTKEWVAIHRKHHAKCETPDDPHSPQTRGIETVLLQGTELYRAEAKNQETLAKYGHGTPDDWLERNLYARYSWQGVGVMLISTCACSARSARRSGRCRCSGSRSPRPASSTASATSGATATSRRPMRAGTSCRGAS
jgi:stearoyl-CoA desaturase (delta-9 desaturase)